MEDCWSKAGGLSIDHTVSAETEGGGILGAPKQQGTRGVSDPGSGRAPRVSERTQRTRPSAQVTAASDG